MKSIRPIHPFPARMAPEMVWRELPKNATGRRILDPMAGSGTTLVTARMRGHCAIGFDRDPLAVLLSRVWTSNLDPSVVRSKAQVVLQRARELAATLESEDDTFPVHADAETKDFLRYWFDDTNRIQLTSLSRTIKRLRERSVRDILWCAFSRLIITKNSGVSLAMDVSHSRPHRKFKKAPIVGFDHFLRSVEYVINASPFSGTNHSKPHAIVAHADARSLPLAKNSVDMVITSPPYLNAIDYIRGHKLSLVWMGYSISDLRSLRSTNIGTEANHEELEHQDVEDVITKMCSTETLPPRKQGMLRQYIHDMRQLMTEIFRVLRPEGKAVLVIGDCNIGSTFVKNSNCLRYLGTESGLILERTRKRPLPENKRYLPPPTKAKAGVHLQRRMREEVILTFLKPATQRHV